MENFHFNFVKGVDLACVHLDDYMIISNFNEGFSVLVDHCVCRAGGIQVREVFNILIAEQWSDHRNEFGRDFTGSTFREW